jgi:hypothetical protein
MMGWNSQWENPLENVASARKRAAPGSWSFSQEANNSQLRKVRKEESTE